MHGTSTPRSTRRALCAILALATVLVNACTAHRQNRTDFEPVALGTWAEQFPEPAQDPGRVREKKSRADLANRVFENYRDFLLAHIEFDDQGQFWESARQGGVANQMDALEKYIEDEMKAHPSRFRNGAVIVTFVHGWNNNSKEGNPNLDSFRRLMARLAKIEQEKTGRRVIGVYASWRGRRVQKVPVLTAVPGFLTYWDRKETAENIGRRSMGETLRRLSFLKDTIVDSPYGERKKNDHKNARSRLVLVGHSFGGAALFSGVSRFFEDELIKVERMNYQTYIDRSWDLVVLVNPAIEALQYATIHRYSSRIPPSGTDRFLQLPRLVVIGASNDRATGSALPVGQTVGDLFRPRQESPHLQQSVQMRTALGHYEPFMTHRLRVDQANQPAKLEPFGDPSDPDREGARHAMAASPPARGQAYLDTFSNLFHPDAKVKRVFPFMVVQAERGVINGHNGIWQPELSSFIADFIAAREAAVNRLLAPRGTR